MMISSGGLDGTQLNKNRAEGSPHKTKQWCHIEGKIVNSERFTAWKYPTVPGDWMEVRWIRKIRSIFNMKNNM